MQNKWRDIKTAPASNGSFRFLAYVQGHGACVCYKTGDFIYNISGKRIYMASHWMGLPCKPGEEDLYEIS